MIEFSNPMEFSAHIIQSKSVPLAFSIKVSDVVANVFYRHFMSEGNANEMVSCVEGLPSDISRAWSNQYDAFAANLLGGRFVVSVSDYSVLDYLFHHAYGFAEQNEKQGLEDCEDLFDIETTPKSEMSIQQVHDLLVSIAIAEPYIQKLNKSVMYTGKTPKYLKYIRR